MSNSELLAGDGLVAEWDGDRVLDDVSFRIAPGEFVTLLGPNGSGKTTLLRCLAGLEAPTAGRIRYRGVDLTGVPTHRREIGLLSQEPSLFPHRTVRENILYGPLVQGIGATDAVRRADALARRFSLERFLDRYPHQLSGGEQQRVALARALAVEPALVLLDEPFASVDPELRAALRGELKEVLAAHGTAALHVTHDREEGLFLGDRMLVLVEGRLLAAGPPAAVYADPQRVAVARLLGYNVVPHGRGLGAVLPEEVELSRGATDGFPARVLALGTIGRARVAVCRLADGATVEVRPGADAELRVGETVGLRFSHPRPLVDPPLG